MHLQPLTLNAIFREPTPDFHFPMNDPLIVVRVSCFKVFQKTPYCFAAGRENGEADHDEKDSLKDGEEKAKDSKPDENPADDQKANLLKLVHGIICLHILQGDNIKSKFKSF